MVKKGRLSVSVVGDSVDVRVEGPWGGPEHTVKANAVPGALGVEGS